MQLIDTVSELAFRNIWILTDSCASIQHLSHWATIGDITNLNILDLVILLSSRHSIYFQWVPSHIGLNGNEIADSSTADTMEGNACLNLTESKGGRELNALWRVPLAHTLGILEKYIVDITS
ncbi:hypothetical protein TNCV_2629391 [Trichonephila clavipes]|uniref:RNase H type-1 domain-containing protein n=1 Tax=Trichonephila clavipes TaxID=2585209 RepID=A0A8X6SFI2_TRICX|nr:hypothetical protein TNCV_2629391 [Trichonephila clavipes]